MLIRGLMAVSFIALLSTSGCIPTEAPAEGGTNEFMFLAFMLLIFVGLYLIFIRPQRKRMKEHQQLVLDLKKGDRVITAGGIYGVIEKLDEETADLRVESGAIIRFARNAIHVKREQ
jgi:preprotein translocase subunit YajC